MWCGGVCECMMSVLCVCGVFVYVGCICSVVCVCESGV